MKQSWNGWNYPKMLPEIIEAVETHFCDEKDVIVDCMLYAYSKNEKFKVETFDKKLCKLINDNYNKF